MALTTWQGDDVTNPTLWNVAANWDTNAVPTAADDVVLPAITNACNINVNAVCRSFDASAYIGTLTHTASVTITIGDATAGAGNVALAFNSSANMTYTLGSTTSSAITFVSTSSTQQTINFNGQNTGSVTFNATSNGSWILTGTWGTSTINAGQQCILTKGTLNTNGQTCYWGNFSSNNGNTRTLTMGASAINIRRDSDWAWYQTSTITITTPNTATITFLGGGASTDFSNISMDCSVVYSGGGNLILYNSPRFTNFTVTGITAKTDNLKLVAGKNLTVTGTLSLNGNSSINRLLFQSGTFNSQASLTVTGATISGCSNVDFRDIAFVSTGAVDLSAIAGGSGDCGGNTISGGGTLTFTTADDWYWQTTGAGTYNMEDNTHWYTQTNGGGTRMDSDARNGGNCKALLPQDNAYFDASSVSGATTVDQNEPRVCKTVDFTGVGAMGWHIDNISQTIYGGLTLVSNVTVTNGNNQHITFEGRSSFNLDMGGKNFGYHNVNINMIAGTLTLTNTFNSSGCNFYINNGTFNAVTYSLSAGYIESSNSNARTIKMGSGTWTSTAYSGSNTWNFGTTTNLTGFDAQTSTISLTDTGSHSFVGGGLTYNNITIGITGTKTITGSNTFNVFTITAPVTVKLTHGTNQNITSLVATGDASNLIHIDSDSAAAATLTDTNGGTNTVHYCHIGETGAVNVSGATFDATDNCNVNASTGWLFTIPSTQKDFNASFVLELT
jgi:hypothetical protein